MSPPLPQIQGAVTEKREFDHLKRMLKIPSLPKSPGGTNLDILAEVALEYDHLSPRKSPGTGLGGSKLPSIANTPLSCSFTSSSGFMSVAASSCYEEEEEEDIVEEEGEIPESSEKVKDAADIHIDDLESGTDEMSQGIHSSAAQKRSISKKNISTTNNSSTSSSEGNGNESSSSPVHQVRGRKKKKAKRVTATKHQEFLLSAPETNNCRTYISNQIEFPDILAMEPGLKRTTLEYFHHMHQSWNITCRRISVDKEFLDALLALHYGEGYMSKTLLKRHFLTMSQMFRDYAVQQPKFAKLSAADQRELLLRNTSLFIHYNLGKYFTAKSGFEQLHWMLAAQIPKSWDENVIRNAPLVTFQQFTAQNSFLSEDIYTPHEQYFTQPLLTLRCNCILGLVLLFKSNMAALFDDMVTIDTNLEDSFSFANWAHELYHCAGSNILCDIIKTVEKISKTFDKLVHWEDLNDGLCVKEFQSKIALQGAKVEPGTDWVYSEFDRVKRSFHNVSLGKDCLKDVVMHSYDVPFSGWFTSR